MIMRRVSLCSFHALKLKLIVQ